MSGPSPRDDKPIGKWLIRGQARTPRRGTLHMVLVAADSWRQASDYVVKAEIRDAVIVTRAALGDECTCVHAFMADDNRTKVPLGWHHPNCIATAVHRQKEEAMEHTAQSTELPKYRSHKVVSALKIAKWEREGGTGRVWIMPADAGYTAFSASDEWENRVPQSVREAVTPPDYGYFVRYADGFESWSPSEAFEEGYTREDQPQVRYSGGELHQPLPVKGYTPQSSTATDAVDANKVLEEQCLRQFDQLGADVRLEPDPPSLALARTLLQEAFVWANRAVFKPKRIDL